MKNNVKSIEFPPDFWEKDRKYYDSLPASEEVSSDE